MYVRRQTKIALRKFTENIDDDSRIRHCECRKKYKQTTENKREEWQRKEAVEINKLLSYKTVKRIWINFRNMKETKKPRSVIRFHKRQKIFIICLL